MKCHPVALTVSLKLLLLHAMLPAYPLTPLLLEAPTERSPRLESLVAQHGHAKPLRSVLHSRRQHQPFVHRHLAPLLDVAWLAPTGFFLPLS